MPEKAASACPQMMDAARREETSMGTVRTVLVAAVVLVTGGAVGAGLASGSGGATHGHEHELNAQDRTFLTGAIEGARFEVRGGIIAKSRAGSPRVKAFGRLMIKDHSREVRDLSAVARTVGVHPPDEPSPEQQKALWVFSHFHGGPFNCTYIAYEYADHTADVGEAEVELAEGRNPMVKHAAARWLKVYEKHLSKASDILLSLHSC
jgi:putative membrane protein